MTCCDAGNTTRRNASAFGAQVIQGSVVFTRNSIAPVSRTERSASDNGSPSARGPVEWTGDSDGALTVAAADRVGPTGSVVGLDANPEMLAVARSKRRDIEWIDARAEALPFPDAGFDAVLSQFALMFFDDPVAALSEMRRVAKPGGAVAVAVCDAVEQSPGYAALAALLERLFGQDVADAFRAPFALGDAKRLARLCREAGIADANVRQRSGTVRFASIDALVSTERACVWTLGGLLDETQFDRLRAEAQRVFEPFADANGKVAFAMPALLITANKRS